MFDFNASDIVDELPKQISDNLGAEGKEYLDDLYQNSEFSKDGLEEIKQVTESFLLDAGLDQTELDSLVNKFFSLDLYSFDDKKVNAQIPAKAQSSKKAATTLSKNSKISFPDNQVEQPLVIKSLTASESLPSKKASKTNSSNKNITIKKPNIVAFSQSSRFHLETLETHLNEIDLKDVNLIVNDRPLLVDAHLQLKEGVHYGLIGKNGTGKSTLLNCMANKTLLGLPENIRIQYVEQIEVLDDEKTVFQTVIDTDEERAKRLLTISEIEHAINNDPKSLKSAVNDYLVRTADEEILQAQKIANFRTGKRGHEARKVAVDREKNAFIDVKAKYYADGKKSDLEVANTILDEKYQELIQLSSESSKARAHEILDSLGFSLDLQEQPVSNFSGGWRMRIALAKAMYIEPDVLLLDEPTNHLDMHAIVWFTEYLKSLDGITLVVVSHDREFLNQIAQEIILIKDQAIKYYTGNYDAYLLISEDLRKKKEFIYEGIERKKKNLNEQIQKGIKHAKTTGDDKKLGMVASRKKKLERLGAEKTEDGKRWKISYFAGYHNHNRIQVELDKPEKEVTIAIPEPEPLRQAGHLVRLLDVSFGYVPNTMVIKNLNMDLEMGQKIAFLGPNGCGKSTLINLIKQNLRPTKGRIEQHSRAIIGHYDQHFVDIYSQLKESGVEKLLKDYGPSKTALAGSGIKAVIEGEQEARAYLGSFGLSGHLATQPIQTLSGGQKARFALSIMLIDKPHVLLLDEITNHLDMSTISGLIKSLKEFKGCIVLVSHDQYFVQQVADTLYTIKKDRTVQRFEGTVASYIKKIKKF
ncbi:ABC transporter F family member 3 [Smittium culicis]|uniref:ABC transporter F family member 3 n=1 Tax=Smittium culicis TaxID=133412 RepID=A0A1R1YB92_9FUNG|nr:ABC transporter F family member 3 [Smittium culicis]